MGLLVTAVLLVAVMLAGLPLRQPRSRLVYLSFYLALSLAVLITAIFGTLLRPGIAVLVFGPGMVVALVRVHIARADIRQA